MKRIAAAVALAGLVACTTNGESMNRFDSASGSPIGDSGPVDGDSGEVVPDAAWFALDAEIELVEGVATEVSPRIRFLPEDTELGAVCTDTPTVQVVEALEVPDPLVFHWWDLTIDPTSGDCDAAARLPSRLRIGLGELYPQVVAGVDQDGLGDVKDSLYGAYASFAAPVGDGLDGTTYAYGYAGTEADRQGATPAVEAGPMPDGRYLVTAFYLFELIEP